ncbi:hypothetical protein JCM10207_006953 [Rhodosporidiobolus poonsookiae]
MNVSTTAEGNLLAYIDGEPIIYDKGDMAWVAAGTALVTLFVPGLALLYSGLLRRKNALSMWFLAITVYALGQLHWMLIGYSLTYSDTGNSFWGNLKWGGLKGVDINPAPAPTIPALLYAIFQAAFEAITMVVIVAGAAERARMLPTLIWLFVWATFVYCPLARWTWDAQGWLYTLGELDFAGGGPVHIASGVAGFVFCWFLGPRRGFGTVSLDYRPQSVTNICLGTLLIWMGWTAFNGACMSAMNLKSASCVTNTNIAASVGALTWIAMDYIFTRKWSAVGACSGVLAGLIGITPAVGYVSAPGSIGVAAATAIICNLATGFKRFVKIDDPVDVGALHMFGGIMGGIMTGFLAEARVAAFDGTVIEGGWVDHHWKQMGYQLAGITSIVAWTAVISYLTLLIINYIPGLRFRVSEDAEIVGIDEAELGEFAYDYLHLRKDIDDARPSLRGRSPGPAHGMSAPESPEGSKEHVPTGNVEPAMSVTSRA